MQCRKYFNAFSGPYRGIVAKKHSMASNLATLLAAFAREWKQQPMELMQTSFNRDDFENFVKHLMHEGFMCKGGMRLVCHEMWHGFDRCIAHAKDLSSEGWAFQIDYNPEQFMRCSIFRISVSAGQLSNMLCSSCRRPLELPAPADS